MARLAYLGTPELAVPPLRALVGAGHHVVLCVTRPDRRRGRGGRTMPSPVKAAATELGVPVGHDIEDLASTDAELGVVVAFGRIIPARLLDVLPMVNVHFSLLPRWRGAAPLERAILAGDAETGVCLMKVEAGLDSGPVYAVRRVPLGEATLAELRDELVDVGTAMLVESLRGGVAGLPTPEPQRGEITIAQKVSREDLCLDWARPAVQLARVVRLGRAWTTAGARRLTVLEARAAPSSEGPVHPPGTVDGVTVATGEGVLVLRRVQPESRSPMSAEEWRRGAHLAPGQRLGRG